MISSSPKNDTPPDDRMLNCWSDEESNTTPLHGLLTKGSGKSFATKRNSNSFSKTFTRVIRAMWRPCPTAEGVSALRGKHTFPHGSYQNARLVLGILSALALTPLLIDARGTYSEQTGNTDKFIKDMQLALNYTRGDGSINCNKVKESLPYCVNARLNRRKETVPFSGKGACSDVIRTIQLHSLFDTTIEDEECAEEASALWEASLLNRNLSDISYKQEDLTAQDIFRLNLQQRLNYTKADEVDVSRCYVKGAAFPIYTEIIVSSEHEALKARATGCVREKMRTGKLNCNFTKTPRPYCTGRRMTRTLEPTPFDGSGACLDVIRTMISQVGDEVLLADSECATQKVRRKLDYITSCPNTNRFNYHFWMFGLSLRRSKPTQKADEEMYIHLHNAQDNVRQFVTTSKQYVVMDGFSKWQQAMFAGNWIDTAENSRICRCTTQDAAFIHVKGFIRGRYLAYNSVKSASIANSCTRVSNHRPAGAPPGALMNGVVQWSDCYMDLVYGET
jgi:hypothetical protein